MDAPYKVVIPASGVGAALGDFIKYTNKALIRVGRKPAISYIIEAYPPVIPIVVTLGYKGEFVREFLSIAYPERIFEYVEVSPFEGPGSSLGYSLLQAESLLQCPFIYQAVDTIVLDAIPPPDQNWVAGFATQNLTEYAELLASGSRLTRIEEKGASFSGVAYVGLMGIQSFASFWRCLHELQDKRTESSAREFGDVDVLNRLVEEGEHFSVYPVERWLDTGNIASLGDARKRIPDAFDNLDKVDESIYLFKDFVVKFFANEDIVAKRVARARILQDLVPPLQSVSAHFYRYAYVQGDLYSHVVTPENVVDFLDWGFKRLWTPMERVSPEEFKARCFSFYYQKTVERVQRFLEQTRIHDLPILVNGEQVPGAMEMLNGIDPEWYMLGSQTAFHGDCVLENLIKTSDGYRIIDWRQDFAGLLEAGDCYYDLAKFYHNLIISHDMVSRGLFEIREGEQGVYCHMVRPPTFTAVEEAFLSFCAKRGLDVKRIRRLAAIIWLNMAPLHHRPFDRFLYYFGRLHLWKSLSQKS